MACRATSAARVLFAYLLAWLVLVKLPYILRTPLVAMTYESCGETAVIVAGAWVLYVWHAARWDRRWFGFVADERGVRLARRLYGFALVAFVSPSGMVETHSGEAMSAIRTPVREPRS